MAESWAGILLNATGKNQRELALACGVAESTMSRSLDEKAFQPDDLRNLWLAFGKEIKEYIRRKYPELAEADLSTIPAIKDAGFEINSPDKIRARTPAQQSAAEEYRRARGLQSREPTAVTAPDDYASALAEIDACHKQLKEPIERIGEKTRGLFKFMGRQHFLVSSTSGAWLLILAGGKEGTDQRDNRYHALRQGLLWALVTPSCEYLKRLKEYVIDFTKSYRTLVSGYKELREDYIRRLNGSGKPPKQAKKKPDTEAVNIDLCMQRLEWDDFPFTPLHWTASLLGHCPDTGEPTRRAIIRSPYARRHSYQLFPRGNSEFEHHLFGYFRHIIGRYAETPDLNAQHLEGSTVDRQQFCEELLVRMERCS